MDKIDFAKKEPTLCKIQLFFKVLLPQDRIDNWVHPGKICLGHSISQKFCIRKSQKECLSKERYFKFQATRIKIKHTVRLPDLLRVLAQQSSPTMMCEHAMRRKKIVVDGAVVSLNVTWVLEDHKSWLYSIKQLHI